MSKRLTREWDSKNNSDNLTHKRHKKSTSNSSKKTYKKGKICRDSTSFENSTLMEAANYESDLGSIGAFTPFSNFSYISKSTTFTTMSRRLLKGTGKQYNLR